MEHKIKFVPQRFRLLDQIDETTMLGNKSSHYRVNDEIIFRQWYGTSGDWGGEYGEGHEQIFIVTGVTPAKRYRDRSRHISIAQVNLRLKRAENSRNYEKYPVQQTKEEEKK